MPKKGGKGNKSKRSECRARSRSSAVAAAAAGAARPPLAARLSPFSDLSITFELTSALGAYHLRPVPLISAPFTPLQRP